MRTSQTEVAAATRRYYATVDDEDANAVAALFAQDATYDRPGYGLMVGRDAILDFYANERVIAHGRHVIDKVICEGNNVAVEGFFTGTLRKGPTVEVRFSDFFVFENGLISMRRTYFSVSAV